MKVTYQHGRITFERDCPTRRSAFDFIAAIAEAFPAESCGLCKSSNTVPTSFTWNDKTHLKMKCCDCSAELYIVYFEAKPAEGKPEKFFAQRNDKDKKPLPHKGWEVYRKNGESPAPDGSGGEPEKEIPF